MSNNVVNVNTAAGETGAATPQVLSASGALAQQSTALKASVTGFFDRVRTA